MAHTLRNILIAFGAAGALGGCREVGINTPGPASTPKPTAIVEAGPTLETRATGYATLIPTPTSTSTSTVTPTIAPTETPLPCTNYTVQEGDTFWSIYQSKHSEFEWGGFYRTTLALNPGIDLDKLSLGQVFCIPELIPNVGGEDVPIPTAAPTATATATATALPSPTASATLTARASTAAISITQLSQQPAQHRRMRKRPSCICWSEAMRLNAAPGLHTGECPSRQILSSIHPI